MGYSDSVHMLDLVTQQWTDIEHMSEPRSYAASAGLGGCIYVCGGANDDYLASAERFDLGAGQWETIAQMSTRRFGSGASSLGHFLYIIGGCNEDDAESRRYSDA